jgi:hypothetical protein
LLQRQARRRNSGIPIRQKANMVQKAAGIAPLGITEPVETMDRQ